MCHFHETDERITERELDREDVDIDEPEETGERAESAEIDEPAVMADGGGE